MAGLDVKVHVRKTTEADRHYHFTERPRGFVIRRKDRVPVTVSLSNTGFHISIGRELRQLRLFDDFIPPTRRDEIIVGMRRVSQQLRCELSHRRTIDISRFVVYVGDFPEAHHGRLPGLVNKAIRWHRAGNFGREYGSLYGLSQDTETAKPPIPVPTVPGLRFLSTVGEVLEESARMSHCIASYADLAVRGEGFLFHFECDGEEASIEVDAAGKVRQSCGRHNFDCRAAAVGRTLLSEWGKGFGDRVRGTSKAMTGAGFARIG